MTNRIPVRHAIASHQLTESGETVLLDEDHNQLLVLNAVGSGIWHLVDGKRSVKEVVDEVTKILPADPHTVEKDVWHFLEQLASHQLIHFV